MEQPHSRLGIASFVISVIVIVLFLALFAVAGVLHQKHPEGPYPGQILVGLIAIGLFFADVVAAGLGIASICQSASKRTFGILGLIFSALTIVGSAGLILILRRPEEIWLRFVIKDWD